MTEKAKAGPAVEIVAGPTLVVPEAGKDFALSPAEKSRLLEAIAQADRGEVIDGWQLLAELKA